MNTIYAKCSRDALDEEVIRQAGQIIREGGLVAFPTETVYGLGGDALNPTSSQKIYEAKGRPSDNPLIVHIARLEDLDRIAADVPQAAIKLAGKFWPGPLTMIFKKRPEVPRETTGGLDTVAVRFPSHPVAAKFIEASGGFVAAPSANISGKPSPTTGEHVLEDMDKRIDMIIDSGPCDIGLESTIIDLTSGVPVILRPGYVNEVMITETIGQVELDPAVFGTSLTGAAPRAPGMKYRHYAPKGEITIVSGERQKVVDFIKRRIASGEKKRVGVICCSQDAGCFPDADYVGDIGSLSDEKEIASRLYDILRRCDEENIELIFSEEFNTPVLGLAIMNRLIKAAGHKIINI